MPAPPHEVAGVVAEALEAAAPHDTGLRPTFPSDQLATLGRHRADVPGEPVADEGDHEGGDDDSEHAGAHERRHVEQRRLAAGEREEEDGDDWKERLRTQFQRPVSVTARVTERAETLPAALRTIRPCPRRGRQQEDDRQRRRRLGDLERAHEGESRARPATAART